MLFKISSRFAVAQCMATVLAISIFSSLSYAQAAPGAKQPTIFESLLPILVMIVVFWFVLIRPQAKKAKDHQALLGALKRGDQVVASNGILGTVEGLTEAVVTLEIADGVRIKVLRSSIQGFQQLNGNQEGKK